MKMRKITEEELQAIKPDESGLRHCPQGEYSKKVLRNIKAIPGLVFPDDCRFEGGIKFGNEARFGSRCVFGTRCNFGVDCTFGDGCIFSGWAEFRRLCKFGNDCTLGPNAFIDSGCTMGDRCSVGAFSRILYGFFAGHDKYIAVGVLDEDVTVASFRRADRGVCFPSAMKIIQSLEMEINQPHKAQITRLSESGEVVVFMCLNRAEGLFFRKHEAAKALQRTGVDPWQFYTKVAQFERQEKERMAA